MKPARTAGIAPVQYRPPDSYRLDIEVFTLSELRRRTTAAHLASPQRLDFHMLFCFTEGRCTHVVDFESVECRPGSLLVLHPGQVQRFASSATAGEAWLVMFRSEFLQPRSATPLADELDTVQRLEEVPVHLALHAAEHEAFVETVQRMARDARLAAAPALLHALLRNQLLALLTRLSLAQARQDRSATGASVESQRFRRFRLAVEQHFQQWHRVSDYAGVIGCSEKSLGRAVLGVAGVSAKTFLSQRIVLEAKRLLVHTALPVATVGDRLGFAEPSNFVKFFRREAGQSPGQFRQKQSAQSQASMRRAAAARGT
jgi:AraC-like DNA-binding protein